MQKCSRRFPVHAHRPSMNRIALQDLVAVAIATLLPVYKRDQASGKLRPASAAEVAEASGLLLNRSDADIAAERLVDQYIGHKKKPR